MGDENVKDYRIEDADFPHPIRLVRITETDELYDWALSDHLIELSECPCDPRRRHERLGQKVAVV